MQMTRRESNLLAQNAVTRRDTTSAQEIQRRSRAPTMKRG
jgi:hypothetical protein